MSKKEQKFSFESMSEGIRNMYKNNIRICIIRTEKTQEKLKDNEDFKKIIQLIEKINNESITSL